MIIAIALALLKLLLYAEANLSNPSHGKCTKPTNPPLYGSPPPLIDDFLPSNFFEVFEVFQQKYIHIPSKSRSSKWKALINSLTPSLEDIINKNITSYDDGPLRLNHDITLHKFVNTKHGRRVQTVSKLSGSEFVPPSITAALYDGFALTVHNLAYRIASINTLTASLAKQLGVQVTADYTVHPENVAHMVSAQDEVHIILSGACAANVSEAVFRYPLERHVDDDEALQSFADKSAESTKVKLKRGDMLYVPRGDVLSVEGGFSLLTLRLHTDEITNADVLKSVIDMATEVEGSPLSESLPYSESEFSYADLLQELVDIAADVTEDLRKHFVVREGVGEMSDTDDDEDAVNVVSMVMERFLRAAHALYEPGMEVLVERDYHDDITQWARRLDERGIDDVEYGFEQCVEWMRSRDLVEEAVAEIFIKWFERRNFKEEEEIRNRRMSLRRYREREEWV